MKLPTDLFLSAIDDKKIYYFSTTRINTEEPHHFICIKRTTEDILIMSCCTSQFNTVRRFIETRSLPMESLVWISPDSTSIENPFTKDTYVNCNSCFTYTIDEFKSMYDNDAISYSGKVSDSHYEQILIGIHSSPLVDNETKEIIPNPDSL
jgi:hypothetical protein